MSDRLITCKNVTVSYTYSEYRYNSFKEYLLQVVGRRHGKHAIHALSHVDLEVQRGESVALLGHNGSGKSTLLKVLAGIIVPEFDQMQVLGRVAPMIELGTGFDGELSGFENIRLSCALMGLSKSETSAKIEGIIDFSEIRDFIDMPLKNYSSGMQARLGFACATAVDPDVLLVDEVLSVGDQNFATKCLRRIEQMRSLGCTIILVSHDLNTARTFCSRGVVLEQGVKKFDGPIEAAIGMHEQVMHERYLRSMSDEERRESERQSKLAQEAQIRLAGGGEPIPDVLPTMYLVQETENDKTVDFARPFTLRFDLSIQHGSRFRPQISVGIGLNKKGGSRIGGANNLDMNCPLMPNILNETRSISIDFKFSEGLKYLCGGEYEIILGIHDSDLTRTIYCQQISQLSATNSDLGFNGDGDILKISKFVSAIEIKKP